MPSSRLRPRIAGALGALTLGAALLSVSGAATAAPDGGATLDLPGTEAGVRASATGPVEVRRDERSGRVEFVRVSGRDADLAATMPRARAAVAPIAKATGWLEQHAGLFGVTADQLVLTDEIADAHGRTLTYTQTYRGVPVWGAALKANLDTEGDLVSINGRVVPDLELDTTAPLSTPAQVEKRATSLVRADPPTDEHGHGSDLSALEAEATPVVYETGSPLGETGVPHLAWQVTVTGGGLREQLILGDAKRQPLNRWSDVHGLTRTLGTYSSTTAWTPTWAEGDSTAGLTQTQRNLLDSTAESYHLFRSTFGRDSFDGAGATMNVRDNRMASCPNASWYGSEGYASFCPGLEVDDVTAHEWGHAYTQHTSGLIYQYQSGALNESYSDVWGEVVDLLNGREDDGADHAVRTTDDCVALPTGTGSPTLAMKIVSPRSLAGPCTHLGRGLSAPVVTGEQTVKVVVAKDAAGAGGPLATDACTAITNGAQVTGKWAYVDRGTCGYQTKVDNLRAVGALGVLIGNDARAGGNMTVTATVPVLMVDQSDGLRFKSLPDGVAASVHIKDPSLSADRHRWLIGETSSMSSLRDMWNPRCAGNAAAVTDAEYHCATSDNGGVHLNSGVPNRAFSLFVDGGAFNGSTVTGVGLDRAAHVWWRANTAHLVPISGFADFADALAESCDTLVGQPLKPLTLTDVAPTATVTPLTTSDCAELDEVIAATALRTDIAVRCNFTTRFTPGDVASACGSGTTTVTGLTQDFETGAGGWSTQVEAAPGSTAAAWGLNPRLSGNAGSAAFAANPSGDCLAGNGAGRSSLFSPTVTVSPDALSPRLRLRHQVSLEDLYDGGNVKLSVNAGAFSTPAVSNWLLNRPTTLIETDTSVPPERRNPMSNERAWSGFDASDLGATWATSVLDLAAAGVQPGDTVQVRFDLGTDYCGGMTGWAVDDVSITWCEADVPVAAPSEPVVVAATVGEPLGPLDDDAPSSGATDGATGSSTEPLVTRAVTRTRALAPARGVRRGRAFTLTARVGGEEAAQGGRVRFTVGGRLVGTAKVTNGVARLTVRPASARLLRPGQRRVLAAYSGTATTTPSKGRTTLRVRR